MILVRDESSQKRKPEGVAGSSDDDDAVDFEEEEDDHSDMDTADVTEDEEEGEIGKGVNGRCHRSARNPPSLGF